MKTIVYYDCLRFIVFLNFYTTMNGGVLFSACTEARTRVLAEISEILLLKNEVGGYTYNDAKTFSTQTERVIKRQLFAITHFDVVQITCDLKLISKNPNIIRRLKISRRDV